MRYVIARINLDNRDMTYRFYITETLKAIAQNTATPYGGVTMSASYADLMRQKKVEKRTPKDIIDNIKKGLGE